MADLVKQRICEVKCRQYVKYVVQTNNDWYYVVSAKFVKVQKCFGKHHKRCQISGYLQWVFTCISALARLRPTSIHSVVSKI